MSIKIMTWVWEHSPYSGAPLLVHLALADHANDEGRCWPSQRRLADKARCTDRLVRSAISRMQADRLLDIEVESNGRKTHMYRLLTPEISSTGTQFRPHRKSAT